MTQKKQTIDLVLGIPTYNSQKYLEKIFESLLGQSVVPKLILFNDDASRDLTVTMIKDFSSRHPELNLVCEVNPKNLGINGNYNAIIDRAGEASWLHILDADDYLLGDYYAHVQRLLTTAPEADLVVTSMRTSSRIVNAFVRMAELVFWRRLPQRLQFMGSVTTRSALIYRLEKIKRHKFHDPFFEGSDIVQIQPFLQKNIYCPKAKVFYRIHASSISSVVRRETLATGHRTSPYGDFIARLPGIKKWSYRFDYWLRSKVGAYLR